MALLERDNADHQDFHGFLPRIGCGICGKTVQPKFDRKQEKTLVTAFREPVPQDEKSVKLRQEFLEEMGKWSRDHDSTHKQSEHDDFQRKLRNEIKESDKRGS